MNWLQIRLFGSFFSSFLPYSYEPANELKTVLKPAFALLLDRVKTAGYLRISRPASLQCCYGSRDSTLKPFQHFSFLRAHYHEITECFFSQGWNFIL